MKSRIFILTGFSLFFFLLPPAAGAFLTPRQEIDSLNHYGRVMLSRQPYSLRKTASDRFVFLLEQSLREEGSFSRSYDSLKTVAVLTPSDRSFRIFNWEMNNEDGLPIYFARLQLADGNFHRLNDISSSQSRPEKAIYEREKWWGAHYYRIERMVFRKKVHYLLLGANFSDPTKRKKVIEVLTLGKQGSWKFGAPLFEQQKITLNRVLFEYRTDVSMSLRYEEDRKRIVFDHLSPPDASLKGQTQYYGPDLSYDAYYWKKGRWQLRENIDARNRK